MAEKKKGRRSYLNDFKKNEEGRYEYGGRLYSYRGDDLGRRKLLLGVLCLGMVLLMAAAGCVTAPGMGNCVYVLLPYAAGLAAAGGTCLAVYRICTGGNPMKAYVYEAGVRKAPGRAAFTAGCSLLAAAGQVIYTLCHGFEGRLPGFAFFLSFEVLAAVSAVQIRRETKKMCWL